jgi:hypothetical protein
MSIFGLGFGGKTTEAPKRAPLPSTVTLFKQKTAGIEDLSTVSYSILLAMKVSLGRLGEGDPQYQRVVEALKKCTTRVLHGENQPEIVEGLPHQGYMSLEQMKKEIREKGQSFPSLTLTDFDDEIIRLIEVCCPNLTELRLHARADKIETLDFTDTGLEAIAKIKNLTHLEINYWCAPKLTPEGYYTLLSDKNLQSRLKVLKITSVAIIDSTLPLIQSFSKLEKLKLQSCFLTTAGLLTLRLSTSVYELDLVQATSMSVVAFNDEVLQHFAAYSALRSLSIGGDNQSPTSKVTDKGVVKLLIALFQLTQLTWNDYPFSLEIMKHLPETLTSFTVGSLSGNYYESALLEFCKKATKLTYLSIQSCGDEGIGSNVLSKLPRTLTHLYFGTIGLDKLTGLPPGLKYLAINGSTRITPSQFAELSKLSLTTLRLINCPTLNDESFPAMFEGPLRTSIETFEIYNATITPQSLDTLVTLRPLRRLLIGQCYGLGLKGTQRLLKSPNLQNQIHGLYLDGPIIKPDDVQYLNYWKELRVLYVGNPMEYPLTEQADNKFLHVRPIVEQNGIAMWFYGEAMDTDFLHPM